MKEKNTLGYIILREWLYTNYFIWAGTAIFFMERSNSYHSRLSENDITTLLYFTNIPYIIFTYFRSIRKAWRVTHEKENAPTVSHEDIEKLADSSIKEFIGD